MVTAQQVFELTMDLIDERLDSGLISESDTITYQVKSPGILTLLQNELIEQGDIYSTHEISHTPIENLLGHKAGLAIEAFEGDELTYEANKSCKAYYFEVDNDCTVYIEDYNGSWNTLKTITAAPTTNGFTAYKGIVTPSNGATKSRLRFTGTYYYRNVNRALYGVSFASDSDVPDYRPWIKKELPDDFKSVDEIINEECEKYSQDANYKWEGRRSLYISYYFTGNIRIVYRPVPQVISALTDNMQVNDVTARTIMPYGLAAHLLLTENQDSASFFNQRFEELKAVATLQQPASAEMITNLYGGFG